ncbi:hypothetical protein CY35_08G090600 [Sphagnum magellanicum]|nr:hypothetical protein CY35_08G090600 [Sphagnum magellanicum]
MAAGRQAIMLDPLPMKRLLALEESGSEHLPPELSQEEKPLALLGRIDFGQEAKKVKSESNGSSKEEEEVVPPTWPWQGLVEHLQQADQELVVILDLISQVEANEAVTVANVVRPKLLPQETCSDLALRASSKLQHFRDVGKYLKRSAQALERQVEREAVFYGALMRLQRNWKVKRQRGIAAGPGGSAGFSIEVGITEGAPCGVMVDQDPAGLLVARPATSHPLASLHVSLHSAAQSFKLRREGNLVGRPVSTENEEKPEAAAMQDAPKGVDRGIGEGVDKGAVSAQVVLRQIQASNFDEQVFEWVSREALLLTPSINVTGLSDTSLQLSLGHATTLNLHLSSQSPDELHTQVADPQNSGPTIMPQFDHFQSPQTEASLGICLQQAFHQFTFGRFDGASSKAPGNPKEGPSEAAGMLKHLSAMMRHKMSCAKICAELEKQVHGVPLLRLSTHPTWHSRVSAWDLWLDIPETATVGRWQARILLQEDALSVTVLPAVDGIKQAFTASCTISELSSYLLYQVAGQLVAWLHSKAIGMGAAVERDLLSITFELEDYEDVALVACPDWKSCTVNWSLRLAGSRMDDSEDLERFLGPLALDALHGILVDLVNWKIDSRAQGDSLIQGDTQLEPDRFPRHGGQ